MPDRFGSMNFEGKVCSNHRVEHRIECQSDFIPVHSLLNHFRGHTAPQKSMRVERTSGLGLDDNEIGLKCTKNSCFCVLWSRLSHIPQWRMEQMLHYLLEQMGKSSGYCNRIRCR